MSIEQTVMQLMAKAEDSGATDAERETAMTMAMKLMAKHNIELKDLGEQTDVNWGVGGNLDRDYMVTLAGAVEHLIPARITYRGGRKGTYRWVATNVNAQAADIMFKSLCRQVEQQYKSHLPPGMTKSARARYRRDFKMNCAIGARIMAREVRAKQALDKGEGTALMVINDELMEQVNDFLESKGVKTGRQVKVRHDTLGAAHGLHAAKNLSFNEKVE